MAALALTLKLVHVLAAVALLANLALLAVWKVWADRRARPAERAFVLDRVHALDRSVTAWAGLVTFASGYPIIRVLGEFGGRIAAAPWALVSLVLMTLAGLAWYFVLLPLEVRMAEAAERAAGGSRLDPAYGRWSAAWLATLAGVASTVLGIAALMVYKPSFA